MTTNRRTTTTVVNFQSFNVAVGNKIIPNHLKTLVLHPYSRDSDPQGHLVYFKTKMVIVGVTNVVNKCNILSSTFMKSMITRYQEVDFRFHDVFNQDFVVFFNKCDWEGDNCCLVHHCEARGRIDQKSLDSIQRVVCAHRGFDTGGLCGFFK